MLQYMGMTLFSDNFGGTKSRACGAGVQVPSAWKWVLTGISFEILD